MKEHDIGTTWKNFPSILGPKILEDINAIYALPTFEDV